MKAQPVDEDDADGEVVAHREPDYSAEQMRALLPRAKQFKAERIAAIRTEIEKVRLLNEQKAKELERWERMAPYEVFPLLVAAERDAAADSEQVHQQQQLEKLHSEALYEAYAHRKGLLPPEVCSAKLFTFCLVGAAIGGLITAYAGWYQFHWRSQWASLALMCLGSVLGFAAGFKLFSLNFLEDKGLDVSDHWAKMNPMLIRRDGRRRV
jgi:hypothetical protein